MCTTSVGIADNIMMAYVELQYMSKWENTARKRARCVLLLSAIFPGLYLLLMVCMIKRILLNQ